MFTSSLRNSVKRFTFPVLRTMSTENRMMKAAIVKEFGKPLVIEQIPIPKIRSDQILMKMETTGVCHTDLHVAKGDWVDKENTKGDALKAYLPRIPGHEGVGRVVEIGSQVENVKVGDRVGIPWLHTACGTCDYCLTGWETLCKNQLNSGFTADGTFAEYAAADPNFVAHIPEEADAIYVAPILCAGITVYKGIKMTGIHPGEWLVVDGLGGLGQLGVQIGKAMGMRVIGIDVDEEKCARVLETGAEFSVNAKTTDVDKFIQDKVGGAHGCIVTAVSNVAFSQGLGTLRPGGVVSLIGLPPANFPLDIVRTVLQGLKIVGSIVGTRKDMKEIIEFYNRGLVKSDVVTDKLDNINQILDDLEHGKVKGRVVIDYRN